MKKKLKRRGMRVRTVYLLRHGDCRRDAIPRYCGQDDLPLNQVGQAQALAWQQELLQLSLGAVISSDLQRARQTARIIAVPHKLKLQESAALREIDMGEWDGRPIAAVKREYPDEYERRGREIATYRVPGGESFAELAQRVVPAFMDLINNTTGNLLLVGHAGVNRVIICELLGMPLANLFRIGQDYGCLNLINLGRSVNCLRWVNLPAGSEMIK